MHIGTWYSAQFIETSAEHGPGLLVAVAGLSLFRARSDLLHLWDEAPPRTPHGVVGRSTYFPERKSTSGYYARMVDPGKGWPRRPRRNPSENLGGPEEADYRPSRYRMGSFWHQAPRQKRACRRASEQTALRIGPTGPDTPILRAWKNRRQRSVCT